MFKALKLLKRKIDSLDENFVLNFLKRPRRAIKQIREQTDPGSVKEFVQPSSNTKVKLSPVFESIRIQRAMLVEEDILPSCHVCNYAFSKRNPSKKRKKRFSLKRFSPRLFKRRKRFPVSVNKFSARFFNDVEDSFSF